MALLTPADEPECRAALTTAHQHRGPSTVRYPRGSGQGLPAGTDLVELPWGKGEIRRESTLASGRAGKPRVAILAFGPLLYAALTAAERLDATVANMRFVKPLDTALVEQLARNHDALVTVEEGCIMGGAGSAVMEHLQSVGLTVPVLQMGLPDTFIDHGDPQVLMARCGLDATGIESAILKRFAPIAEAPPLRTVVNA